MFQKKKEDEFQKGSSQHSQRPQTFQVRRKLIKRGETVTSIALRTLSAVLWVEFKVQEM